MLYDADRIAKAAGMANEDELYPAQLDLFLDPYQPKVQEAARQAGIPQAWLEAAQQSPIYKMAMEWKVAFPLHPEYRTLPMVWYVPPLSPIQSAVEAGKLTVNGILPDVQSLRIPVKYLANLLTAGQEQPIIQALERMLAMRAYLRAKVVDGIVNTEVLERVGLRIDQVESMYRTLAIANFEDRFVIPTSHREYASATFDAYGERGGCGFSFGNNCAGGVSKVNLFGGKRLTEHRGEPIKVEPVEK
jgi:nitrate reductase beta subunit